MFNSYSYSSNNSININAVSGTIVKNYRKSFILRFHMKSPMAESMLSKNPSLYIEEICSRKPVVVLQVMLCGDEELLAEVMWEDDFDEIFKAESEEEDADSN